ncbi:hypothetical protein ROLI_013540 [Roseobacter fucihabitans]|uniref:Uncharacterized protein n=1 Tax=Roseobacter fucihabitans TaxID=1537242 RepID=A0ABZ2BQK1_9RHOB|nr:hypothetical protein [Roseobacter litoralis]
MNVGELDGILLPLYEGAETRTSIVKSSLLRYRMPDLSPTDQKDKT